MAYLHTSSDKKISINYLCSVDHYSSNNFFFFSKTLAYNGAKFPKMLYNQVYECFTTLLLLLLKIKRIVCIMRLLESNNSDRKYESLNTSRMNITDIR